MGLRGLDGKVAVIFSGASGLGSATTQRIGREGCRVVVADIAVEDAEATAQRIARHGGPG